MTSDKMTSQVTRHSEFYTVICSQCDVAISSSSCHYWYSTVRHDGGGWRDQQGSVRPGSRLEEDKDELGWIMIDYYVT